MSDINFPVVIKKFDEILSRGLSSGLGKRNGQMCIEAAICAALDLPHSDAPDCVSAAVRSYKIRLNDSRRWKSPKSRAAGLRELGIAQIGSAGTVTDAEFSKRLAEKTIRVLIPKLFREIFPKSADCLKAANRCEAEGSSSASASAAATAYAAADVAYAAADAAAAAAYAAANATAYAAADVATAAADAAAAATAAADAAADAADAAAGENYLLLSARLALETLKELKSPGCEWL